MNLRCMLLSAVLLSATTTVAMAQSTPATEIPVPGSDSADFQIFCNKDGKPTFGIHGRNDTAPYQVARHISYVPLGNGQYALHFLRGFTTADQFDTYFPANGESCEVTQR